MVYKYYALEGYNFNVTNTLEEVINSINDAGDDEDFVPLQLDAPSELGKVLLCSSWGDWRFRLVDFTNTTNLQAIEKILTFYKHKTFRRCIGDHTFFEGFMIGDNAFYDRFEDKTEYPIICLGS